MEKGSLRNSPIWQYQTKYFSESGINAWKNGVVPHYVSSNLVVAKTYAELAFAFLCDIATKGETAEKVYLIELGAGHGRLCYHFLKHLEELIHSSALQRVDYCYVLSDFSAASLDYFKDHPRLKPYFQKGVLDYCLLDALDFTEIELRFSGTVIKKGSLANPLVMIANYFFDTIPQDVFLIKDQGIHECKVHTEIPEKEGMSAEEIIKEMTVTEESHSRIQLPYYEQPFLNLILQQTAAQLNSDTFLLFPHEGLKCIDTLKQFSRKGIMLLSADRGQHNLPDLENQHFPQFAVHGSFSYPVNYYAMKIYCEQNGGINYFPLHRHESMVYGCLLILPDPENYAETRLAHIRFLKDFNPDDFYILKQLFVSQLWTLSFTEILAIIRLSSFDARLFLQLLPRLTALLNSLSDDERWDVFQLCHKIWEYYFPLGETEDLAFSLGVLLFSIQFTKEALVYFQLSDALYGYNANRAYNIALCQFQLDNHLLALDLSRKIQAKSPGHPENSVLLKHLEEVL